MPHIKYEDLPIFLNNVDILYLSIDTSTIQKLGFRLNDPIFKSIGKVANLKLLLHEIIVNEIKKSLFDILDQTFHKLKNLDSYFEIVGNYERRINM